MNKQGQSIIEYTLIAVFVLLGVFFMGPYVLRSIDAHFKLWDEGVRDSFEENLRQAPVGDVPYINTTCQCNAVQGTCGSNNPGSLCGPNEREVDYACSLQGCNGAQGNSYCVPDNSCCGGWNNLGCGNVPLSDTPPANNCHYGYRLQQQQCGTNPATRCDQDSTCPLPQCTGLILNAGSTMFCSTSSSNPPTNLNQNTPINYVQVASQSQCPAYQLDSQIYQSIVGTSTTNTINATTTGTYSPWSKGHPDLALSQYNFFFFNFHNYGFLLQTVDPNYAGPIIPGSSKHHLVMLHWQSDRNPSSNGCHYQTINGKQLAVCDSSIVEDDSKALVMTLDDPPSSWAPYEYEILDSNYNEIFHFWADVDSNEQLAFISYDSTCTYCNGSSPCQAYCGSGYVLNGAGTGCIHNYPFVWWSATFGDHHGTNKSNTFNMTDLPRSEYTCCLIGREADWDSGGVSTLGLDSTGTNYQLYLYDSSNGGQVYAYGFCTSDLNYQCPACNLTSNAPPYQCSNTTYTANTTPYNAGVFCPSTKVDNVTYQDPYMQTDDNGSYFTCNWPSTTPGQGKVVYHLYQQDSGEEVIDAE